MQVQLELFMTNFEMLAQVHDEIEYDMKDITIHGGKRVPGQYLSENDALKHFDFHMFYLQEMTE